MQGACVLYSIYLYCIVFTWDYQVTFHVRIAGFCQQACMTELPSSKAAGWMRALGHGASQLGCCMQARTPGCLVIDILNRCMVSGACSAMIATGLEAVQLSISRGTRYRSWYALHVIEPSKDVRVVCAEIC